jgi:Tfp pilus assembly protein PilV
MLEVMISLAILAGGLLAMLALQISAMRQGRVGRDFTEAAFIAQDRMEQLQRLGWADPQVQPTGWTAVVNRQGALTGGGGGGAQVAEVYGVQERITATADANLRLIDVRVTWVEPNAPAAAPAKRYAISSQKYNSP